MTPDEQSDDREEGERWIDELRSIPRVTEDPERDAEAKAWEEMLCRFNIEALCQEFEGGMS